MGIYIKGMEMPFTCLNCDFHKCSGGVGDFCSLTKRRQFRFKNRPIDCPLIEVPEPHGRLGDLDELGDSFEPSDFWNPDAQDNCFAAVHIVHSAPTIIPASGEE